MPKLLKSFNSITDEVPSLDPLWRLFQRPLLCAALALALGLWLGTRLPQSLGLNLAPWMWVFAAVSSFFSLRLQWKRKIRAAALFLALAGFAAGLARVQPLNARLRAEPIASLQGRWIEGRVIQDRGVNVETLRHALILDQVRVGDLSLQPLRLTAWPGRVKVSYDTGKNREKRRVLGPGDRIGFEGSLWFAQKPTNPGEFDYRSFLAGRNITASAGPHSKQAPQKIGSPGGLPLARLAWRANQRLGAAFDKHLSPRLAALGKGAILGDKSGLGRHDVKAYTRSGLAYLLAVSGLHLALALGLFMFLAKRVSRRAMQALLALAAVMTYAMVTGLQVPAQRAACLFVLLLLARALDFETDFAVSLAFGAILVLLAQPGALWEAGFQLSFLVTTSIVYLGRPLGQRLADLIPRLPLSVAQFFGVVWSAQAAVVPLTAYHFHQFTWPAFVCDGSVAWTMPLIIALGLAMGLADLLSPLLASWLALPLGWCLAWLDKANAFFAELPGAVLSVGTPGALFLLSWFVFAASLALYFLKTNRRSQWALLPLGLMFLWTLAPALPWAHRHLGETRAWFLDVGQGDSILIEFGDGKTLLVDAGPQRPNAGSWVVEPALRALGISRVDWVALSHPHADHIGGLQWLAAQLPLGRVFHSGWDYSSGTWKRLKKELKGRGIPLAVITRENPPSVWKDRVQVLSPSINKIKSSQHDMHNNGLVLRVEDWLMLTGDLGLEGEAALLEQGLVKPAAVLKAGHHGSRTSSSLKFLKALKPATVVVQTGRRYIYRHPHVEALNHFKKVGSALWRTDLQGCVLLTRRQAEINIRSFKAAENSALWKKGERPFRFNWKAFKKSKKITPDLKALSATVRNPVL